MVANRRSSSRLPTPIRPDVLRHYLDAIGYDAGLTRYLVNGFEEGFSLCHTTLAKFVSSSNARILSHAKDVVQTKLSKELSAGRIAGPFDVPPFSPFQISPLNLREKKVPGTYRLLHNLSFPYDETSVNANIPQSEKTVKMSTVGDAIQKLLTLPLGAYTAKTDIADAYRLLPIAPADYPKLGMHFDTKYYYDKCLPQGCGSSCRIFETFSTALQAIFERTVNGLTCVHMIDDFFLMTETRQECEHHLASLLAVCDDIGVPMAPEKTTVPATNTVFLGIELDTVSRTAKLPQDKLREYMDVVEDLRHHRRVKRKTLESVIGKLSFAASVVPARPFLRRMIDLLSLAKKPHHYIRLTLEVLKDLDVWSQFLHDYNGVTYFRALHITPSDAINMASDASKLGFGAVYGKKWLQAAYPTSWQDFHITVLELYPILVMINVFGHLMKNSSILFHCDNSAVVAIINKQSSRDKLVMAFVRPLVLLLILHNIHLRSVHIPGVLNILPDKISRFQTTPSLLQDFGMDPRPTTIPKALLPENFTLQ